MAEGDTSYYYMRVGKKIRAERQKQDIGLRPFALMSGLDFAEISKIENGKANPTLKTMIKLANSLDVDLGCFFEK